MTTSDRTSDLDVRTYLRVLNRRKWLIVAVVVMAAAVAFVFSNRQTRQYRSSTTMLFVTTPSQQIFGGGASANVDASKALAANIRVLGGKTLRDLVAKRLGFPATVTAVASSSDPAITLTAESESPQTAARIANTYAQTYIEYLRTNAISDYAAAQSLIQQKIGELQAQVNTIQGKIAAVPANQPGAQSGLQAEQQTLLSELASYQNQVNTLQIQANITGGVQVVEPAEVPSFPFAPTPKRSAVLAASLGLLLGLSLAFILEFVDDSIKGEEDIERAAPGVPVLAMIPPIAGWKNRKLTKLIAAEQPNSMAAEAYRTLRTSIQFMGLERPLRSIQITSPSGGEGKTTTVANLGVVLSTAGKQVLIIGCDLRRPRLHDFLGIPDSKGFTSMLIEESPITASWQEVPGLPRLRALTEGPLPPNPSELLSSPRARQALAAAREAAQIVLVDSPPVLPVTDAVVLSKLVDATICVVTVGQTTRRELKRALDQLHQVDATVIGIVLNGVSMDGAGYGYEYSHDRSRVDAKSRRVKQPKVRTDETPSDDRDEPDVPLKVPTTSNGSNGDGSSKNGARAQHMTRTTRKTRR